MPRKRQEIRVKETRHEAGVRLQLEGMLDLAAASENYQLESEREARRVAAAQRPSKAVATPNAGLVTDAGKAAQRPQRGATATDFAEEVEPQVERAPRRRRRGPGLAGYITLNDGRQVEPIYDYDEEAWQ